jgi:hypothetical protein
VARWVTCSKEEENEDDLRHYAEDVDVEAQIRLVEHYLRALARLVKSGRRGDGRGSTKIESFAVITKTE